MDSDLAGKRALVTGASRGIGRGIAVALGHAGVHVAVHGRDEQALETSRAAVVAAGVESLALTADLTDEAAVSAMADAFLQAWGPPDVLVANAGGNSVPPGPIEAIGADGWRRVVDDNLTATYLTLAAFLPAMKAHGSGAIVTVSSTAARSPHERSPAAYAAAKAGIESLTRNLAVQAGPCGIRVNAVAPGTILTEANATQIPQPVQAQLVEAHPLRRLGAVDDVADAVRFLASPASGWITGVVLDVTGGRA